MGTTISEWVVITQNEKAGWSRFYNEFMGSPLSDIPRFLKAVSDFGHNIMFESILAASSKKLNGDPLNYVIGIAIAKASEEAKAITDDRKYRLNLEKSKQRIITQNEELEELIERARNTNGTTKKKRNTKGRTS